MILLELHYCPQSLVSQIVRTYVCQKIIKIIKTIHLWRYISTPSTFIEYQFKFSLESYEEEVTSWQSGLLLELGDSDWVSKIINKEFCSDLNGHDCTLTWSFTVSFLKSITSPANAIGVFSSPNLDIYLLS